MILYPDTPSITFLNHFVEHSEFMEVRSNIKANSKLKIAKRITIESATLLNERKLEGGGVMSRFRFVLINYYIEIHL